MANVFEKIGHGVEVAAKVPEELFGSGQNSSIGDEVDSLVRDRDRARCQHGSRLFHEVEHGLFDRWLILDR